MDGWRFTIGWLCLYDDVDRLHVKIDNLNDHLVGFCFIRSIDSSLWIYNGMHALHFPCLILMSIVLSSDELAGESGATRVVQP
jgi:hypothetical protein